MNTPATIETSEYVQVFLDEYGECHIETDSGTIILVAKSDFLPIQKFRELLERVSTVIKDDDTEIDKFIFDKSTLRTFHQPSMEWYYLEWKIDMLEQGLKKHFKIMPDLDYFVSAVEAAKKPLLKKMPQKALDELRIEYYDSVEAALNAD